MCSQSVEECLQPTREEHSSKIPRDIRVVCQHSKCSSVGDGIHYLESTPLGTQICCSRDNKAYRKITKMEACWYQDVDMSEFKGEHIIVVVIKFECLHYFIFVLLGKTPSFESSNGKGDPLNCLTSIKFLLVCLIISTPLPTSFPSLYPSQLTLLFSLPLFLSPSFFDVLF